MSPRPYQLGKREQQINELRRRVIDAARRLLADATSYTEFTIDAVAGKADVARATIYYQFDSKTGLLDAVCDSLAGDVPLPGIEAAFTEPDPERAVGAFIAAFARLWATDRATMRRLRALAVLDPDVGKVIAGRDERRQRAVEVLVARIGAASTLGEHDAAVLARALFTLTSFETFDSLAAGDRPTAVVTAELSDLASAAVRLHRATNA